MPEAPTTNAVFFATPLLLPEVRTLNAHAPYRDAAGWNPMPVQIPGRIRDGRGAHPESSHAALDEEACAPGKKLLVWWEPSALAEGSNASALRKRVGL
jgi:hypothetical protein